MASGVVSALDGGNFTNSFISGAAASGIGSYAQSIKMKTDLMVASTTVMGGAIAWLTGGDFLQGAIEGMNIGFFNDASHNKDMLGKPALCKVNPDGTLVAPYDLDEVNIYYHPKITIPDFLIEQPLEPVYPEFDILLGIRCVVNMLSGLFTNTMPKGFSTYREFKRVYGSAGKGFEWHHIVERPVNVERFGAERIHNTDNIIALPTSLHRKISGFYSSKTPFSYPLTVRDWLSPQSFEEQYEFVIKTISVFVYCFISTIYVLNGRKVTRRILSRLVKMKI